MPSLPTRRQQPSPVNPQVPIPGEFPAIPREIIERFDSAADWQSRLNEFWGRTAQAMQEAQKQTAAQVNSTVIWTVDRFLVYTNDGNPMPIFALDSTGIRLGRVLVVNTPGGKVYIGAGNFQNDDTPFYIDTLGRFSLGASLTWDPDLDTLTITGIINATSGTIGGFEIGADYIRDTINSFGLASTVTGGDDVRLWAGQTFANRATAPFRVTEAGLLFATGATISGTVTATSGTIGGFDVGSDYIRDTANSMGLASTVTGLNDVRFWAGNTFANRSIAPFIVYENGDAVVAILNAGTITVGSTTGSPPFGQIILTGNPPGSGPVMSGLYIESGFVAGNSYVVSGVDSHFSVVKGAFTGITARGFYARLNSSSGAGTIDNAYGLYIDTVNIGTANWGLYVATTARNYMAGDLTVASIGSTTPGTGAFTTLSATGAISTNTGTVTGRFIADTADARVYLGTLTNHPIQFQHNGSNVGQVTSTGLNSIAIGSTTPGTGAFTTLSATGLITTSNALASTGAVSANAASRTTMDFASGVSRVLGWGTGTGTYGTLDLGVLSSDASLLAVSVARITSTGLAVTGGLSVSGLAGVGTRAVVVDAAGNMSAP
jgi:hypothetical protein